MKRSIIDYTLPALLVLLMPIYSGAQNDATSPAPKSIERIRTEERRQSDVGRNLGRTVDRIDWLLTDLESNRLVKEGGGDTVSNMGISLAKVQGENVPSVTGFLRKARTGKDNAYPHLDSAGKEIQTIIAELDRLLDETASSLNLDDLLAEIAAIIDAEELLRDKTLDWGKALLVDPAVAEKNEEKIADTQEQLVERLTGFGEKLEETIDGVSEGEVQEQLQKAQGSMKKSDPQALLEDAAASIREKRAADALDYQDEGLDALKELEKLLSALEETTPPQMADALTDGMEEPPIEAAGIDAVGEMEGFANEELMDIAPLEVKEVIDEEDNDVPPSTEEEPPEEDLEVIELGPGNIPVLLKLPVAMMSLPGGGGEGEMKLDSSSTRPAGERVKRTQTRITALEKKQRSAAIQKYVQQISPEFRKQVAEYYEVIAE